YRTLQSLAVNLKSIEDNDQSSNNIISKNEFNFNAAEKEKGNFSNFNISEKTIQKLKARGINFLFPVQYESYNAIYHHKDCIVQARTGTGKTLAFTLPLVEHLQNAGLTHERGRRPQVLIMEPTRELTKQISDDLQSISSDLNIVTIYGGKKYEDQEFGLQRGCDIIVATPGRLQDLINNGKVSLANINHVVLDEVDRMLDMGFKDDVDEILSHAFQAGMFSEI
ncbi:unnamed protein product, partial [Didymodactylos carnosus]